MSVRTRSGASSLFSDPAFLVALVIAVVVALGFGLVAPVLPLFARSFGVGLFAVTFVVSSFAGVRLVSNVYAGALADRIGTHRAVAYGVLVVAVSSGLCAVAPGYWWLVAFRGVGGFGSALFFTALLALVVRVVPVDHRGRAVGTLQGAFLVGIAIGPGVGGLLAEPLGLRAPFAVYAACLGVAALVAMRWLPRPDSAVTAGGATAVATDDEGAPAASPRRPGSLVATLRLARELSRDRAFLAALVMMAASRWAATGVRFSLIPVFGLEVVGASKLVIGNALMIAALAQMAMVWPAGRLADTLGRRATAAPAYLFFAVVSVGLSAAVTVPAFLGAMVVYGLATGLTAVTPPSVVADVTPDENMATGMGILNTAGDLGSVLGPLVSGLLAEQLGYGWGFGSSAVLLAAGAVFALRMRETLPARAAVSDI